MPSATKTFLLRAIASFVAVLLVNVLSSSAGHGGVLIYVSDALRYILVGAGLFFLVVAGSAWGVALGSSETAGDARPHK